MLEDLKQDLISLDIERLKIRNEYKKELRDRYLNKIHDDQNYVYFPKFLVSEDNEQLRYGISWLQNGFIIKILDNVIVVDPSVNFLLRLTESNYDLTDITHIFVSHSHLDHSSDADALIDFLLRCNADIKIIAPSSVFETRVISEFHSGMKPIFSVRHESIIVNEKSIIELKNNCTMKFIKLNHSVETFGFKIVNKDYEVVHLSDTSYSKKIIDNETNSILNINEITDYIENASPYEYDNNIKEFVKTANVLITNIDSFIYTKNSKTHLPLMDLIHIVENSSLVKIVISHINPTGELKYDEWSKKIGEYTKGITGINTYLPSNSGLKVKL